MTFGSHPRSLTRGHMLPKCVSHHIARAHEFHSDGGPEIVCSGPGLTTAAG